MKLTDAERARVAEIRNMKLTIDRSPSGGLSYFSTVDAVRALTGAIRDLIAIIDRLSQEPEVQTCASCRWCRESDKTNRLFCFANGLESEFQTFNDEYCSGYERRKEQDDG